MRFALIGVLAGLLTFGTARVEPAQGARTPTPASQAKIVVGKMNLNIDDNENLAQDT